MLQVGDELIQYDAIARTPPYGFTGCHRGAFGTKVLPHDRGTPVHHLFVRYQTFQPDEDSTLVDDLAAAIAQVFNTCGFDMIYQDGSEGMAGGWYGMARMREAIFKKLRRERPGGGQRLGPLRVGLSFPFRRLGLSQLGTQAIRRRPLPGQRGFSPHGAPARTARLVGHPGTRARPSGGNARRVRVSLLQGVGLRRPDLVRGSFAGRRAGQRATE